MCEIGKSSINCDLFTAPDRNTLSLIGWPKEIRYECCEMVRFLTEPKELSRSRLFPEVIP